MQRFAGRSLRRIGCRKPKTGVTETGRLHNIEPLPALHPMTPVDTQGMNPELATDTRWD
jgi:hypothetical protein